MVITVMRKVPFCAGHRLLHHEGKCANLHGHNYIVEFHVTGSEVDELGRVVDFAVINRLFKSWIDENWDHGFLLWEEDRDAIQALRQVTPHRITRCRTTRPLKTLLATCYWKLVLNCYNKLRAMTCSCLE